MLPEERRSRAGVFAVALALWLGCVAAHAAEDDATWGVVSAGGAVSDRLRIPRGPGQDIHFAPTTCPTAIVGDTVWDLAAGQSGATLEAAPTRGDLRALSSDGKQFAAVIRLPDQKTATVGLWSTATGEKLHEFRATGREQQLTFLGFAGSTRLVTACLDSAKDLVEVWDTTNGTLVRKFLCERLEQGKTTISPNGWYLAATQHNKAVVFDLRSGSIVSTLKNPVLKELPSPILAAPGRPAPRPPRPVNNSSDSIFIYASTHGFQFSADGKELAALSSHPRSHLMIWDRTGSLVADEYIAVPASVTAKYPIVWSPDSSMILLRGTRLFDRKLKRVVWSSKRSPMFDADCHFVDNDKVLMPNATGDALEVCTLPVAEIRKSLEAMAGRTPAVLRPGQAVSIEVEVGDLTGGDKQTTTAALFEAMGRRLAMDGIKIAPNQQVTLRLKYGEKAGETHQIVERTNPFGQGRDTGQTAQDSLGNLSIEMLAQGSQTPVWQQTTNARSSTSFSQQITPEAIRTSMVQQLLSRLQDIQVPYFVPADTNLKMLPIVAE